jgi:hypothetical protein
MDRRFLLLAGAAIVSGCAASPMRVAAPSGASFELLEPLVSAVAGADGLTIRVASHGCTRKADFALYVERAGAGARVAFGRKRVDACKAAAAGPVDLTFSYDELGARRGQPLFVLNPIGR